LDLTQPQTDFTIRDNITSSPTIEDNGARYLPQGTMAPGYTDDTDDHGQENASLSLPDGEYIVSIVVSVIEPRDQVSLIVRGADEAEAFNYEAMRTFFYKLTVLPWLAIQHASFSGIPGPKIVMEVYTKAGQVIPFTRLAINSAEGQPFYSGNDYEVLRDGSLRTDYMINQFMHLHLSGPLDQRYAGQTVHLVAFVTGTFPVVVRQPIPLGADDRTIRELFDQQALITNMQQPQAEFTVQQFPQYVSTVTQGARVPPSRTLGWVNNDNPGEIHEEFAPLSQRGDSIVAVVVRMEDVVVKHAALTSFSHVGAERSPSRFGANACANCKDKVAVYGCSRCKKTSYCSKKCQLKNWDTHEADCSE
jgi:hypothetical protein